MVARAEDQEWLTPPSHRSTPIDVALSNALTTIDSFDLKREVEEFGGDPYPTFRCTLRDREATVVSIGAGKGRGQQALASALFESIEHYLLSWESQRVQGAMPRIEHLEIGDIQGQEGLEQDRVLARLLNEHAGRQLPCSEFRALDDVSQSVWYPLILTDPGYQHHPVPGDSTEPLLSFLKYATSSGTASGNDPTEALIHALTELIERDAISLALLHWYIALDDVVRRVDPLTLPHDLRELHAIAEAELESEIAIMDISSDVEAPTYLSGPVDKKQNPICPAGSGTSLRGQYALERSLTEVLQTVRIDAGSEEVRRRDELAMERLCEYPSLYAAAALDIGQLLGSRPVVSADSPMPAEADTLTPDACLLSLRERLGRAGLSVYWRALNPSQAPVTVVTALAPGIERFNAVRNALPVLPSGRGEAVWQYAVAQMA